MGLQDSANNQKPTGAENQDTPTGAENQDTTVYDDGDEDDLADPTADPAANPATDPAADPATDPATDPAADPATDPAADQTADLINQEKVNNRINKLTFEKYEERRKREELETEHQKVLKRLKELEGEAVIEIPPMPDVYDPEYSAKLTERDNAIQAKAKADAAVELKQQQAREAVAAKQKAQRELVDSQIKQMQATAKKLGISEETMSQADQTVSMFIKDPAVARFILGHNDSALIVNHLGKNISTLEKMANLDSINSVAFLVSEVLPKAKEYKPAVSDTPDPLEIPDGKPGKGKDPYLDGVTFE